MVIYWRRTISGSVFTCKQINRFVHILSKYDADFNLYCGSYYVDAKSLLGIMTMDLRNSMWMTGNCEPAEANQIIRELGDFVAA